jgi:hypothetical protein
MFSEDEVRTFKLVMITLGSILCLAWLALGFALGAWLA